MAENSEVVREEGVDVRFWVVERGGGVGDGE